MNSKMENYGRIKVFPDYVSRLRLKAREGELEDNCSSSGELASFSESSSASTLPKKLVLFSFIFFFRCFPCYFTF